jgi:hypothetical protein
MDVLHSEEAHKEDESTLPHAIENPAPEYPFVKELIYRHYKNFSTYH